MLVVLWLQSLLQDMESRRPRLEAVVSAGEQLQQRVDSETERDALRQQGESGTDRWSHSVSLVVTLCVFWWSHCVFCWSQCVFCWSQFVSTGDNTVCLLVQSHTLCLLIVTRCVL